MDCCLDLPVVRLPSSQAAALAFPFAGSDFRSACAALSGRAYHIESAGQPRRIADLRTGTH
jgi:hypothetical protein